MKKKNNFLHLCILLTATMAGQKTFAQTACMVAWYKLDGNATDQSGNGLNGTTTGTTPTTDRFGRSNKALHFNGSSDFVRLGTDADFAQRTISLWFKPDTFSSNWGDVFFADFANIKYGMTGLSVDNKSGTNSINAAIGSHAKSFSNPVANSWYNFIFWVDASYVKFYINGQILDSFPNNSFTHSGDGDTKARLGTSRKSDHFFKGSIDDVKIYDCALSRADLQKLYTASSKPVQQLSALKVYPNPAEDHLVVEAGKVGSYTLQLIDMTGRLVEETSFTGSTLDWQISPASGVYLLTATDETGLQSRVLVDFNH